jgi:two-component system, sensor histidine kinase RegB
MKFKKQQAPASINLQRLVLLRSIVIAGQIFALLIATYFLLIPLPVPAIITIIGTLALFNLFSWWRANQIWPVTDSELFIQLATDAIALALLLYLSGGSTNPFVSLFLLPLTLTAALLTLSYTTSMALLTLGSYTLLLFYYVPIGQAFPDPTLLGNVISRAPDSGHMHGSNGDAFGLHIIGMWFNYLFSAVLVSFFVVRMAATLRERDRLLAHTREETLRNERIVAMGTLAAGAAHELGTPLSTMAVITNDLQHEYNDDPVLSENLKILREQVSNCKKILSNLLASSGSDRALAGASMLLDAYLMSLLDKWQLLRPNSKIVAHWTGARPAPEIFTDQTLSQAILNLLNNAADASSEEIELHGTWDHRSLLIEILDRGPGLSADILANAGKPFFTTKAPGHGFGIGLFLANATIERLGGTVQLFNRAEGGACTRISLPLSILTTKV